MTAIMTALSIGTLKCWLAAATAYDVPPGLLLAIVQVESAYHVDALAYAPNGTYSVGLMQINSSWFPQLRRVGIDEKHLFEPCANVSVGAWILSQGIARYGPTWEAIGAYYAGPYDTQSSAWKRPLYRQYAWKVLKAWKRINKLMSQTPAASIAAENFHDQLPPIRSPGRPDEVRRHRFSTTNER